MYRSKPLIFFSGAEDGEAAGFFFSLTSLSIEILDFFCSETDDCCRYSYLLGVLFCFYQSWSKNLPHKMYTNKNFHRLHNHNQHSRQVCSRLLISCAVFRCSLIFHFHFFQLNYRAGCRVIDVQMCLL